MQIIKSYKATKQSSKITFNLTKVNEKWTEESKELPSKRPNRIPSKSREIMIK